jgi:hypothetical protein
MVTDWNRDLSSAHRKSCRDRFYKIHFGRKILGQQFVFVLLTKFLTKISLAVMNKINGFHSTTRQRKTTFLNRQRPLFTFIRKFRPKLVNQIDSSMVYNDAIIIAGGNDHISGSPSYAELDSVERFREFRRRRF